MKKEDFEEALKRVRTNSPKRNFNQSVELIITLKGLNLKKPEEQVDAFIAIPHARGKPIKVAALVGAELHAQAKKVCAISILDEEFRGFEGDKKRLKALGDGYDFFLGQATLMPSIAKVFGRVLGPKGKMPNPKAGCVVPPNAMLQPVVDRLQKTVRLQAKTMPMVQVVVGNQSMEDNQLMDNIMAVYNHVVHALPGEENNVRAAIIKLAMGPPVKVGAPVQPAVSKESQEASKQMDNGVEVGKMSDNEISPKAKKKTAKNEPAGKSAFKRSQSKKKAPESGDGD